MIRRAKKTGQLHIRITKDEENVLRHMAKSKGVPVAVYVRELLGLNDRLHMILTYASRVLEDPRCIFIIEKLIEDNGVEYLFDASKNLKTKIIDSICADVNKTFKKKE